MPLLESTEDPTFPAEQTILTHLLGVKARLT